MGLVELSRFDIRGRNVKLALAAKIFKIGNCGRVRI